MEYDVVLKVLMTGDSGVGKSNLLLKYTNELYSDSYTSTIGIDFKSVIFMLGSQRVKLHIWDSAGQERFRTITTAYYRGAMGVMLVFDVTSSPSFHHIRYWAASAREHVPENAQFLLVATKVDRTGERVITTEQGQALAYELGCRYIETSSKTDVGVRDAFRTIAQDVLTIKNQEELDCAPVQAPESVELSKVSSGGARKGCCTIF
jgi:Ras-related protein Rab-8A